MRRFRIAAVVFLITLASGRGGIPQTGDIILGISETGARRIPVALPDFQAASSAGTQRAAGTITQTLRDDLAFSGYFSVVKPALYSDITGYSENRVLYKDWLGIGAESVVLGKVLGGTSLATIQGLIFLVLAPVIGIHFSAAPACWLHSQESYAQLRRLHRLHDNAPTHYRLVDKFDPVLFDHRIGEDVARDGVDVLLRLLAG